MLPGNMARLVVQRHPQDESSRRTAKPVLIRA
jgi:hypothetical protein